MKIASAVNEGKLVPEDVVFGLLSKRLEEGYCRGESGFILDGIPRTIFQAVCTPLIARPVFVLILIFEFSFTTLHLSHEKWSLFSDIHIYTLLFYCAYRKSLTKLWT